MHACSTGQRRRCNRVTVHPYSLTTRHPYRDSTFPLLTCRGKHPSHVPSHQGCSVYAALVTGTSISQPRTHPLPELHSFGSTLADCIRRASSDAHPRRVQLFHRPPLLRRPSDVALHAAGCAPWWAEKLQRPTWRDHVMLQLLSNRACDVRCAMRHTTR